MMEAEPMTVPEGPRSTATGAKMSTAELARLAGQLTPRQLQDEYSLALLELKGKGVKVGVAAGILLAAVVFLASMAISILVAAIMGLALVMPAWLAALIVAAVFLVVGSILALIGYSAAKRTMPLLPAEAIRGVRYDVGVLREGSSFDPATLEEKPEKEAKPEKAEREEPKPPAPTLEELRARTSERRDHLATLRDDLGRRVDLRPRAEQAKARAKHAADAATERLVAGADSVGEAAPELKERWKPLATLAVSLTAMGVMLRRLLHK
jgi:Putative Actinobacterial Holin-X, holin superfamily III